MELAVIIIAIMVGVDDIARRIIDLQKYRTQLEFNEIKYQEWLKDE